MNLLRQQSLDPSERRGRDSLSARLRCCVSDNLSFHRRPVGSLLQLSTIAEIFSVGYATRLDHGRLWPTLNSQLTMDMLQSFRFKTLSEP